MSKDLIYWLKHKFDKSALSLAFLLRSSLEFAIFSVEVVIAPEKRSEFAHIHFLEDLLIFSCEGLQTEHEGVLS